MGLVGGFLFVGGGDRFEVFGLEDLPAVQATDIVDAVAARDHFRSRVLADGFHKDSKLSPILFETMELSSPSSRRIRASR